MKLILKRMGVFSNILYLDNVKIVLEEIFIDLNISAKLNLRSKVFKLDQIYLL